MGLIYRIRKWLNNVKLRQRLIFLLLFIGVLPTLIVSIVAYINISHELTTETTNQLASIAVEQNLKINALLEADQEDALKLADQYDLQADISAYVTGQTNNSAAIDAVLNAKVASEESNVQSIAITNQNNVIYASTLPQQIGQKLMLSDTAKPGQENVINEQYDPVDDVDKVYISTGLTVNQKPVGTLTLIYDTDDFVATVQDYTGLGNTGDTIVAEQNSKGQTISLFPLRFNPNAALTTNLDSLHLFSHVNSTYRGVKNYRGQEVMVSVQPVAYANWVTATEIDTAEAFQPIIQLRNTLIFIVLISSILIIAVALYFARFFTAPILTLTMKTRAIMQGDYSQRIHVSSNDEIGILANSFNEMSSSLQTSSRKLNEEHARLRASLDSLNLGFLMTTKDGNIFMHNPAMLHILDIPTPDNTSGLNNILLEDVQKRLANFNLLQAIKECLESGRPFTSDEISLGSRFISIIGAPIYVGQEKELIGAVLVIEDITEAKILARSRDEFFSIASHELRTPLTAIQGNSAMILEFFEDQLKDENFKEMLNDIYDSSIRLIEIVNDFLDVSRIEQGKIKFKYETVYMEKIIESVVYEMRAVLKEKELYLKFDHKTLHTLPPVWADADRIKQIVYNLVGNAAKFTENGGITIRCETKNATMKVYITDTGRGIQLDQQQLLFHKFQQAGSSILTRDTTRGTGLGLYISKMLIERMGGSIQLEKSEPNKGTTFSFTLPLATDRQKEIGSSDDETTQPVTAL